VTPVSQKETGSNLLFLSSLNHPVHKLKAPIIVLLAVVAHPEMQIGKNHSVVQINI
jgi:hypothetical protein